MKKIFLIFIFVFFGYNANASQYFDLKINNIKIGESLLQYYSNEEIKEAIAYNLDFYKVYEIDNTFVELFFNIKNKDFKHTSFYVKPDDPEFIIYGLSGAKNYQNKINECYEYLSEQQIKFNKYKNTEFFEEYDGAHPIDPSGKSLLRQLFYSTQLPNITLELSCADFDASVQEYDLNKDYFGIYLFTDEVSDWLNGE